MRSSAVIALVAFAATVSAIPPLGGPGLLGAGLIAPGAALISSDNIAIQAGTDLRGINRDVANLAGAQVTLAANAANAAAANNAALINSENVQAIQNARQVAANRINQAAAIQVQNSIAVGAAANNQAIQAAQAALGPIPGIIPAGLGGILGGGRVGIAGLGGLAGLGGIAGLGGLGLAEVPLAGPGIIGAGPLGLGLGLGGQIGLGGAILG